MNKKKRSGAKHHESREPAWVTEDQFRALTLGKRIVFWGCFDWFEKSLERFNLKPEFLVDRSKNQQGQSAHHGFDVFDPTILENLDEKDKYLIVLTISNDFDIAIDRLIDYGFLPGISCCVSPLLNNRRIISDIASHSQEILISSSNATAESAHEGGGLYVLNIPGGVLEKKTSGICRGMAFDEDSLFVVDALNDVCIFDNEFRKIGSFPLPKQSAPHGIAIDRHRECIFVVLSQLDSIGVFDINNFRLLEEIRLSDKRELTGRYHHHYNDICVTPTSLLISMFSVTGNVQYEVFDGAIVDFDIDKGISRGSIVDHLWQPHSVCIINEKVCFLDSMRGNMHVSIHKVAGQFNGFVRGLDYDGRFFFIGQSTHRYFDRMLGTSNNISLDCGVFLFDSNSKASKFFATPTLADINSVRVLPEKWQA